VVLHEHSAVRLRHAGLEAADFDSVREGKALLTIRVVPNHEREPMGVGGPEGPIPQLGH
jgi:hypothetical protein